MSLPPTPPTARTPPTAPTPPTTPMWQTTSGFGIIVLGLVGALCVLGLIFLVVYGSTPSQPGSQAALLEEQTAAPAQQKAGAPAQEKTTAPTGGEQAKVNPAAVTANTAASSGAVGLLGSISTALGAGLTAAIAGIAGLLRPQ